MMQRRGPGGVKSDTASDGLIDKQLNPHEGWYCKACKKGPQFEEPCNNCGRDMHGRLADENP